MNLICPHCQQTVGVPDELGGQTSKCPQCGGPFTVPLSTTASAPAAPTEPPKPLEEPAPVVSEPATTAAAESQPSPLAADYGPRITLALHPAVVRWIPPAALLLLFILMWFPWLSTSLGGIYAFSQSGLGAAFSSASPRNEEVGYAPWLILYFIALLLGLIAGAIVLVAHVIFPRIGKPVPPPLQSVVNYRAYIFGGLTVLTFLFLVMQLVMGLPAETSKAFAATAPEAYQDMPENYLLVMRALLHRTIWLKMAFSVNVIAVLAILADLWLERRPGRPLPKLEMEW